MLFVVSFAIFTLILTIFENIFLALIVYLVFCIWIFIYPKIIHKAPQKPHKKILLQFLILNCSFLIPLVSICVHSCTYNKKLSAVYASTGLISQNGEWPQWQYFVGTGEISDIYSYHKYIFQDNAGREYFLKSTNSYKIWDIIWLNWYVTLWYTWSDKIFHLARQLDEIKTRQIFSWFFHYEFNYPKREMMKWYYGTINEQKSVLLDDSGQDISVLQHIRKSLQESIISAFGETRQAWLVLWMLIWDRSQIHSDDYQWFIDSWLVHIIAVSGWNIVMIVVFLSAILFFLPFYARNAVILITIICYALVCGLDSSVFRATIMWWLSLLAIFWWREIDIYRAMWIAFVVMLIVNPYFLVYDVWFLLSFSAIIWIVLLSKYVEKVQIKRKERNKSNQIKPDKKSIQYKMMQFGHKCLSNYILPTIWATLWVLPIMLFFMWWTNVVSILANFLVSPIIAIVMIYGFISTILFGIVPREIWIWPEKILINYIYFISDLTIRYWIYLQAIWSRIKYSLLFLFVVRLVIKLFKMKTEHEE